MPALADTSVFNYLILLDQLALLPALYAHVIIPTVVLTVELPHPDSPASVRAWVEQLTVAPPWLERDAPTRQPDADLALWLQSPDFLRLGGCHGQHSGRHLLYLSIKTVDCEILPHTCIVTRQHIPSTHKMGDMSFYLDNPLINHYI